ncbi:MAG: preprotein translocase subunit SecG [Fimbriimonadaceae bacterium]|nr:preprotein translocase subunit SecG [Fimbriimonadaceae bacterium]
MSLLDTVFTNLAQAAGGPSAPPASGGGLAVFANILIVLAVLLGVVLCLVIFVTGKGDAMSGGGGSVRTSFKGKAGFDDQISNWTFMGGIAFMALCALADILNHWAAR